MEIEPIPGWLMPLRELVAHFAGDSAEDYVQVLVSEYSPAAGIGWHKDKAVFDHIVGVSLGAPCILRLRRQISSGKWQRTTQEVLPGYVPSQR